MIEMTEELHTDSFSLVEQLLFSAVRIQVTKNRIPTGSTGTGFRYHIPLSNDRNAVFLVSNKHVLEDAEEIAVDIHIMRPNGAIFARETIWISCKGNILLHPDPNVDLAAIGIAQLLELPDYQPNRIYFMPLSVKHIPDDWRKFDALEEVLMIGCPQGLMDERNRLPIIRRGYTASHPGVRFNGRPEFMVDMACFPGSSGSPIFAYSYSSIYDRERRERKIESRFDFLGVLHAGPTQMHEVTLPPPATGQVTFNTMIHLGYATRSSELNFLNAFLPKH